MDNIVFDEAVPDNLPTLDEITSKCASRMVSVHCDERMPHATTDSPYTSEKSAASAASPSITGAYSNIECKYYINSKILGTGHHGSVRECVDRATGQLYAVKSVCKSDPVFRPGSLAREIRLLKEMEHHSIIRLVDVYEDSHYVHIVTDLCKGGELFDKIVEKASNIESGTVCFSEQEAARIMYQLLKAISYMHRHSTAHRDIKPENILFETTAEDSPIKIIDFGLSRKHYGSIGEPPMDTVVGTAYYIAPEVLLKRYDKSCDLWSSGVVAYILLCGYPPFNGDDNKQTHRSVLQGRYCFPVGDWSYISGEAIDFIQRLLQMDPRRRMTAEEALSHPWILKHANENITRYD